MKKILIFSFIIALTTIFTTSCKQDSNTVTTEVPSLKGAYILLESASAAGSEYSYVDVIKDTVFNNIYQNSNNGIALSSRPGAIKLLNNKNLLITCGGAFNQNGNIYLINTANQKIITTKSFGNNPGDFTVGNDKIYVSSRDGAYLTEFAMNLDIIGDYIAVGYNPSRIIYTTGRYISCKSFGTNDNSLGIVNGINNYVTNVNFPFTPVCIVNNLYGYFLSGCKSKKVYKLDSVSMAPVDSLAISTPDTAIGDIVKRGENILLVVVGGQEVWEINLTASPVSIRMLIASPGGNYGITALAYENITNTIYIADNMGGPPYPGKIWLYDASSGAFKKNYNLYGRNPVGITFMY